MNRLYINIKNEGTIKQRLVWRVFVLYSTMPMEFGFLPLDYLTCIAAQREVSLFGYNCDSSWSVFSFHYCDQRKESK